MESLLGEQKGRDHAAGQHHGRGTGRPDRRVEDAAAAYFRGEVQTYLTLIKHTDDYTLMAPLRR